MNYFRDILRVLLSAACSAPACPPCSPGMLAYSLVLWRPTVDPQGQSTVEISRHPAVRPRDAGGPRGRRLGSPGPMIIHHFGVDLFPMLPRK